MSNRINFYTVFICFLLAFSACEKEELILEENRDEKINTKSLSCSAPTDLSIRYNDFAGLITINWKNDCSYECIHKKRPVYTVGISGCVNEFFTRVQETSLSYSKYLSEGDNITVTVRAEGAMGEVTGIYNKVGNIDGEGPCVYSVGDAGYAYWMQFKGDNTWYLQVYVTHDPYVSTPDTDNRPPHSYRLGYRVEFTLDHRDDYYTFFSESDISTSRCIALAPNKAKFGSDKFYVKIIPNQICTSLPYGNHYLLGEATGWIPETECNGLMFFSEYMKKQN